MAIIHCTCKNEEQDKLHGSQKRVANKTASNPPSWRCTVCLKEVSSSQVAKA